MKTVFLVGLFGFWVSLFLSGCGGGESTLINGGTDVTPTTTPIPTPIPTIDVTATPTPSSSPTPIPTFSLSGSISLTANIAVDSDTNDSLSSYTDNSDFSIAQRVDNRTTVNGFSASVATGNSGDRFELLTDEYDVYVATLQKGQVVQLQVVDYSASESSTYIGDLDLYLFNKDKDLIVSSISSTEYEQVTIPEDGIYYVVVEAFSGVSKYVLTIGVANKVLDTDYARDMQVGSLIVDEAIVKEATITAGGIQKSSQASFQRSRAKRVLFDRSTTLIQKSTAIGRPLLMRNLQSENAEAYAKYTTLQQIKALNQSSSIAYASPNYLLQSTRQPSDKYYSYQWHYPLINLTQAWDIETGESSTGDVIVAVVDTGVFLRHPDLQNTLVDGYDFISSTDMSLDGDGIDANPDDPGDSSVLGQSSWHGTHVAGIIAAQTNNDDGVAGVSWGAKIMPLRALGNGGGSSYDIIQAVRYAAGLTNDSGTVPQQRADIINLSLGGPMGTQAEAELFRQVADSGVFLVAAAGNENTSLPNYPASYPGVFSVSAVTIDKNLASYSNFGSEVDIAAPGGDSSGDSNGDGYPDMVLSTYVDDSSGERQAAYNFASGTSMASPHVSGVIALMKAVYPNLTPGDLETILAAGEMTNDLGEKGRDDYFGYGLIDAQKAIKVAQEMENGGELPEGDPLVVASDTNVSLTGSSSTAITLSNRGGGTPNLTSITRSDDWITVVNDNANSASGVGSWVIVADTSSLVDGTHRGTVQFNFATSGEVLISVSVLVGANASIDASVGQLYLVVVSVDTDEAVGQTDITDTMANSWSVGGIPAGNYYIVAGTDIDNDGYICQYGEVCGAYPNITLLKTIDVVGDTENLDFAVNIMSRPISTLDEGAKPQKPNVLLLHK